MTQDLGPRAALAEDRMREAANLGRSENHQSETAQSLDAARGLLLSGDDGTDRAWEDIKSYQIQMKNHQDPCVWKTDLVLVRKKQSGQA
jgi:hypothetical protein